MALFSALASADRVRGGKAAPLPIYPGQQGRRLSQRQQGPRQEEFRQKQGRQVSSAAKIQGGVDFSGCVNDVKTGFCCVEKEETVQRIQKVSQESKRFCRNLNGYGGIQTVSQESRWVSQESKRIRRNPKAFSVIRKASQESERHASSQKASQESERFRRNPKRFRKIQNSSYL